MLSRFALRLITVQALLGKTWAGQRVEDSAILPIDELADDHPKPFIAVYTDDASHDIAGRNVMTAQGTVSLTIEIGATAKTRIRLDDGSTVTEDAFAPTDGAIEYMLDMIERQALSVMTTDDGVWPEMWRRFAMSIKHKSSVRGASNKDGSRFAGRQIIMQVKTPADPMVGAPPGPIWSDLLAILDAAPQLTPIAVAIRSAIDQSRPIPHWQSLRGMQGLSLQEARAMQLTPDVTLEGANPTPDIVPQPIDAQT